MSRYDRDEEFYGGRRGRGYDEEDYGVTRGDYGDYGRGGYGRADYGREGFGAQGRGGAYGGGGRGYEEGPRGGSGGGGRGETSREEDEGWRGRGGGYDDERRDYGRRGQRGASRSHVRCRDIMTRDVTVATRDTPLTEVARMMRDEDTGVIPVVDRTERLTDKGDANLDTNRVQPNVVGGGKLVGLITDRDIAIRAVAEGRDVRTTRAEEIMTSDIHTAQPNDRVIDAIRKMGDKQVRRIPVVDRDGNLRGIISMADVALETEEDRELAEALEEISSGASFWNRIFG